MSTTTVSNGRGDGPKVEEFAEPVARTAGAEPRTESREQVLMRQMGMTRETIERRLRFVDFGADDLARIASIADVVRSHIDEITTRFFAHLESLEEASTLFRSRELLKQARDLKAQHLKAMVGGEFGLRYAEQRIKLGLLYSRAGLDTRVFFGAFQELLRTMGTIVMRHFAGRAEEGFAAFASLEKVALFDVGLIVDVLVAERERTIRQQQDAIRELSTPVLQIRDRLLLLPIIGVVDSHRAQMITENLLQAIRANRAKVVVMDVTGVATIDSKVANHLLRTVASARLMGAAVVVTGLTPEVAQSLVALGIELSQVNSVGDLQGGLEHAERILGLRVVHESARDGAVPSGSS